MTTFGYIPRSSLVHNLTGASKLLLTLALSISAMITFDTRYLVFAILISMNFLRISKMRLYELKSILIFIFIFMIINNIAIFLFAPEQGVLIYGTRHEFIRISQRYAITSEQLFYQLNVSLKYFAVVPAALVFFLTTESSEFASSLNAIKVNYKIAFAVSLSLRYIPDIQRVYRDISQAQQARGIDISKKAPLKARVSGVLSILFPLVFSSLDRIELISNAMEMRGFGLLKKRTWYSARAFSYWDAIIISISVFCIALSILTLIINNGRFYNPFA